VPWEDRTVILRRDRSSSATEAETGKTPRKPGTDPTDWPEHLAAAGTAEGPMMIGPNEAGLLHRLAAAVETGCIVEVGSYRGRSAIVLAAGAREDVPVYAVEPHEAFKGALGANFGPEDRGAFYRNMLASGAYREVRLVNLSSEVVTPGWRLPVGLLFIDGDHSYEGVRRDYECWKGHLAPGALVAFDDSVRPELGPARLIGELSAAGEAERLERVGKITVMRLTTPTDPTL
jgi:predicted O-methyltransferase YrrM